VPGADLGRPRAQPAGATTRPRTARKLLRPAVSAVLIGAAFGFALPHVASYRSVWASVCAMSWPYALLVGTAATASMAAYWITIRAVLPWIRVRQAAAVRLGSNAVANTLPAGGALAMGVSWAMLSSWGLSAADYVLCTLVTGIWNVFALLGLPALALLVMATGSRPGAALITAAAVGMALLATMACGLGLLLRSPAFALRAGRALQRPLAVTYLPPIPLGALACLAWRHAPALISTRPHQTSQPSDSRRSQAPALTSSPP
jgi:putative heme transporter